MIRAAKLMTHNTPPVEAAEKANPAATSEPAASLSRTLSHAVIDWQDARPHASDFGDIYYASDAGLEESHFVFTAGCNLPTRFKAGLNTTIGETGFGTGLNFLAAWYAWREARTESQKAEQQQTEHSTTECSTAHAGRTRTEDTAKPDTKADTKPDTKPGTKTDAKSGNLTFFSTEAFPLKLDDLVRSHAPFPKLAPLAQQLTAQWPPNVRGHHTFTFEGGRVRLILLFGASDIMLADTCAAADAWFLDGFAPSKNTSMWSDTVFDHIARLSKPGTLLATFTAAGFVRRALQARGFYVQKAPGFGRKRERLIAAKSGSLACRTEAEHACLPAYTSWAYAPTHTVHYRPASENLKPWATPNTLQQTAHTTGRENQHLSESQNAPESDSTAPNTASAPKKIAVVGAGISGLMAARALTERGARVSVFDAQAPDAWRTRTLPAAVLAPRFMLSEQWVGDFLSNAYVYTMQQSWLAPYFLKPRGLSLSARLDKDRERLKLLAAAYPWGQGWLELRGSDSAPEIYLPHAGCLNTRALVESLRSTQPIVHSRVVSLGPACCDGGSQRSLTHIPHGSRDAETEGFDSIIIAAGPASHALLDGFAHGFTFTAGSTIWPQNTPAGRAALKAANTGLMHSHSLSSDFYASPLEDTFGRIFGSTFHKRTAQNVAARAQDTAHDTIDAAADTAHILQRVTAGHALRAEDDAALSHPHAWYIWQGERTSTNDHYPQVGALCNHHALKAWAAPLAVDALRIPKTPAPVEEGLFLLSSMGSKGFHYAPYLAEVIAALVLGEAVPLGANALSALSPSRFLIRDIIRGRSAL